MSHTTTHTARRAGVIVLAAAAATALAIPVFLALGAAPPPQFPRAFQFWPGNLVVSRSVYDNRAANVAVGTILPPNCAATTGGCSASTGAPDSGMFPDVFNDALYDGSFGITSRLFLDQMTPWGQRIDTLEVPNSLEPGIGPSRDQLVTSFSSKSEGALNLSASGRLLTFMDYVAPVNVIDASNANTPGVVDPTNPVGEALYRAAATVDRNGHFTFTLTNAYSGNNGRAVYLNDRTGGAPVFYSAGNAGNGSNPQPAGVVLGAGAQIFSPAHQPEARQNPGTPTPFASFSVTLLGDKADKVGKDDNFRGLTVYNNVVYLTKGSGSNGVDTVYFVDTTGAACPAGVGIPSSTAVLPTTPLSYDPATLTTTGLPSNMCILAGFPTILAKKATTGFPFGLWFANPTTLYVADEGDGFASDTTLYTHAAAQTTAGLQKWVFDSATATWQLAYVLQNGLNLGTPYTVPGYPAGNNTAPGGTGLPWAPAADGLRNLTGRVNPDGSVTIWAITSTVSGSGDQGADPNQLVAITDKLANTDPTAAAQERFFTLRTAGFAEVLRGVGFTPGTGANGDDHAGFGRDNH